MHEFVHIEKLRLINCIYQFGSEGKHSRTCSINKGTRTSYRIN